MQASNTIVVFPVDEAGRVWDRIGRECHVKGKWGIAKLREGLQGHVGSVVLERCYTCKDHRNLHSHFYSKKFVERSCYCKRLHFFKDASIDPNNLLFDPKECQQSYVGFCVIRPVINRYLGRTVIDPARIDRYDGKSSFCLTTHFRAHLMGSPYVVNGFPYTSQDAEANVCAHTALWSVCRYLSTRYNAYKETYPYDIISLTGHSQGRTYPYRGMTYIDYCEILSAFGCHPVLLGLKREEKEQQDPDVFRNVCAYIESGFPVLASLPNHVIVLIGHTVDYAKQWKESDLENGFIDSSFFWKHLIVSDDNAFPYAKLGKKGEPDNYTTRFGMEDISTAVCPLPEKAFLSAQDARTKAIEISRKVHLATRLGEFRENHDPLVFRLFLTSGTSFKARKATDLRAHTPIDHVDAFVLNYPLPHFVWVVQIAPLSLYRNGECVAEIVLDSTASRPEPGLLYVRVANQLDLFADGISKKLKTERKRFSLYRHNLGEDQI